MRENSDLENDHTAEKSDRTQGAQVTLFTFANRFRPPLSKASTPSLTMNSTRIFVASWLLFWMVSVHAQAPQTNPKKENPAAKKPDSARRRARPQPSTEHIADGVSVHRDLAYVTNGHQRQKLDLYLPDKSDSPLPLIIWVHGGGWAAGSKNNCPPLHDGYTQRGFAVASIGYRLSSDAIFPAQIQDCKAAIRWLRAQAKQYNLDPEKFAAWGSSAGGHLVALLGTSVNEASFDVGDHLDQSSQVQAVCDYYGPTDLLQMDAHAMENAPFKHDLPDSPESRLIGGPIQNNKAKAARANPITYITRDASNFFIVHGDKDRLVPHHQSELLYQALRDAGARVRFHTLEGAGHGNGFGGSELESMVRDFFDKHLKGESITVDNPTASATRSRANTDPTSKRQAERRRNIPWKAVRQREDANNDEKVTRTEFKGPPPLFDRLDRNRDGVLTSEDFSKTPAQKSNQ